MKIGILTQPLHNNYGGLLQNYALQTILKRMGHEVWTINRNKPDSLYRKYGSLLKRVVMQKKPFRVWMTKNEKNAISIYTQKFVRNNIQVTHDIRATDGLIHLQNELKFAAYVVGSDQVWRPRYSPCLPNYFLDFIKNDCNVKKITYAASFGVDDWEFTEQQTQQCRNLAQLFGTVSVREDSAVELCKQYLNVDAIHVLDPTMLLKKEDYECLVNKSSTASNNGNLFVYILDRSENKREIVKQIAKKYNLTAFETMAEKKFSELENKHDIDTCIFPSVEQWIRSFMDAEFVITDSFHGTVFSILFNKPFISIANKDRGLTRFTSLLKLFHIKDRLIFPENFSLDELQEIDWKNIDTILTRERKKSTQFLKLHLD